MCMLNGFAWHFCAVFQQRQTWFFKENAHLLMTGVAGSSCSSLGQTETHLFCQVFCDVTRQAQQHSDFSSHFFLVTGVLTSSSTVLSCFVLLLSLKSSLYILHARPMSNAWFTNIFSQFVVCPFINFFIEHKYLI